MCDYLLDLCFWKSNNQHAPHGTFYFLPPQTCSSPHLPLLCNNVSFHPPARAKDPRVLTLLPSHSPLNPSASSASSTCKIHPEPDQVSPHTLFYLVLEALLPGFCGSLHQNNVFKYIRENTDDYKRNQSC